MDVLNVNSDGCMGKSENRNGLPWNTYVLLNTAHKAMLLLNDYNFFSLE